MFVTFCHVFGDESRTKTWLESEPIRSKTNCCREFDMVESFWISETHVIKSDSIMNCKTCRYITFFFHHGPNSLDRSFYDLDESWVNLPTQSPGSISEPSSNSIPSSKGGRCNWNCWISPISLLSILSTYTRDRVVEEAYVVYIHLCLNLIPGMSLTCVFLCRVTNVQAPRPKTMKTWVIWWTSNPPSYQRSQDKLVFALDPYLRPGDEEKANMHGSKT